MWGRMLKVAASVMVGRGLLLGHRPVLTWA